MYHTAEILNLGLGHHLLLKSSEWLLLRLAVRVHNMLWRLLLQNHEYMFYTSGARDESSDLIMEAWL